MIIDKITKHPDTYTLDSISVSPPFEQYILIASARRKSIFATVVVSRLEYTCSTVSSIGVSEELIQIAPSRISENSGGYSESTVSELP